MTDNTIRKAIYVKATRTQAWEVLTEQEHLAHWFHAPVEPFVQNQRFEMQDEAGEKLFWGNVRDVKPADRLEFTFTMDQMDGEKSKVILTVKDVDGGTRISLVHSNLPRGVRNFGLILELDAGWDEHLKSLRERISDHVG
jgi:uncharacterized protein YndB with AHSA1/START domain